MGDIEKSEEKHGASDKGENNLSNTLYIAAMEPESVKVLVVPANEELKSAQETNKAIERRLEQ
jgi:acetate kinase